MSDEQLLPEALRARPRDAPGLAWTAANAYAPFSPSGRPGLLGSLLRSLAGVLAAAQLIFYLPIVVISIGLGSLARRDRHALILVRTSAPLSAKSLGVGVGAAAAGLGALLLMLVLRARAWIALGVFAWYEAGTLWIRTCAHGSLRPRREQLKRSGALVLDVGLYAAHPRGQGHGPRLLAELLPAVPPEATLLVTAATPELAALYRSDHGFTSFDAEHPNLLERAPTILHRPAMQD